MSIDYNIYVTTDISDLHKLLRALSFLEKVQVPEIIKLSTKNIERNSKKLLRTGKRSGHKYPYYPHVSSKAGEPPRSQTGYLAASIKSKFTKTMRGERTAQGIIYATAPYASYLEHGTSHMEPRPFFKPTLEKEIPVIRQKIIEAIQ
jgi:HK97 gp10 family phage protein